MEITNTFKGKAHGDMPDIIKAVGLTKKYGNKVTAVNGLDLTVGEGELFALLGVNGAGKTTTVKMLTCLTALTDGDASLDGLSIREDADKVKKLSVCLRRKVQLLRI